MVKLTLNYPNVQDEAGHLHSIVDENLYLTFGIWLYLVPQYKPRNVLMLGYGGGTVARYINKFYSDVPITAVDSSDVSEFLINNVEWIRADASDYVKTAPKFDAIVVDLYDANDMHQPSFVFTKEFADNLGKIANYIILYTIKGDDISVYNKYHKVRTLNLGRTDKYAPEVHYYMINDIPELPIR